MTEYVVLSDGVEVRRVVKPEDRET